MSWSVGDSIDRAFLQELRKEAINQSKIEGLNESWKRAYLRLADAANVLDAYRARCEARLDAEVKKEGR